MTQKEYLGGVEATTLSSGITNVDTAISVADGSTFPTGSSYPFVIVVDRGTASEEKILCSARSGNSITASSRGYDGTTGVSHTSGAVVEHCIDAIVVNKSSELISKATTQGDLIYWSAAETPVRLAKGTARQALLMNSGATAPEWGTSLSSLLTTQGDLPYASAANTPARLAKGTAGQVLKMNSGATAPEWAVGSPTSAVATVTAQETTTSTSYTDLATPGPAVTLTTGTKVMVIVTANVTSAGATEAIRMGYAVSDASTVAAADATALLVSKSGDIRASSVSFLTGLTAGSNTFTAKYKVSSGTGTWFQREIAVIDLGS